jgi:hypothetical protein
MNKNELKDFIEDVLPEGRVFKCIELTFYVDKQNNDTNITIAAIRGHMQGEHLENANVEVSVDPMNSTMTVRLSAT